MWSWWFASNNGKKGKIHSSKCIQSNEGKIYKNWKDKILLGLDPSEHITNFNNHGISERNIKCDLCTTKLWNDMSKN